MAIKIATFSSSVRHSYWLPGTLPTGPFRVAVFEGTAPVNFVACMHLSLSLLNTRLGNNVNFTFACPIATRINNDVIYHLPIAA